MGMSLSNTGHAKLGHILWMALLVVSNIVGRTCFADDEYRLVWADEFDRDGPPDPESWTFEDGFVRNDELQWYQPSNAHCKGGVLAIEARRERVVNPRHDPESERWDRNRPQAEYTSASLMTRGRHEWLYGRFVMRGRIDTRPGLWPAFWTLGSARRWPGCGEIDIMEYYRGKLLANAAWLGGRRGQVAWDSVDWPLKNFPDDNWADGFHEWRMDWDQDRIQLFVDDTRLNEIDVAATVNGDRERAHPFREPHYLILNLAVRGTNGGDPSATKFPARFEVDYVRVYQRASAHTEPQ
jgi:beta-glucanase (GH16 family)